MVYDVHLTVAVVGLERTSYTVFENAGVVEVCAIIYSPSLPCPIDHPFEVRLSTLDNSAGNVYITVLTTLEQYITLLYSCSCGLR